MFTLDPKDMEDVELILLSISKREIHINFVIIQILLIFLLIGKEFPLENLFEGFFTPCNKSLVRCKSRLRSRYRKFSSFF